MHETAEHRRTTAERDQERLDHLRIAALQQAIALAAAKADIATADYATEAAEKFFAFLANAPLAKAA